MFEALDKVEKMLEGKEFFIGNQLTEADIRLWVTIVRFCVTFLLFQGALTLCNRSRSALIQSMSGISNVISAISAMDIRISTGLLALYVGAHTLTGPGLGG